MGQSTKTRSLSDEEYELMLDTFSGRYMNRNRALFVLGCWTGYRISELLSLTIGHVYQRGRLVRDITITHTKNGHPRSVLFHPEAQEEVGIWLDELREWGITDPKSPLFISRKGNGRAISVVQAWEIISSAADDNDLDGVIGTHSMRKTLGMRTWKIADIYGVAKVLGHRNAQSTEYYLEAGKKYVDSLLLSMSSSGKKNRRSRR